MKVFSNVNELVGNTPLMELKNLKIKEGLNANIFAKLEFLNPSGSVKDRAAKFMLDDAEKKGLILAGGTIIEPTSGNTGIGLAMLGAIRGYKVILTMPNNMSQERIKALKIYGAEVILTDSEKGMAGSIEKAIEINKNTPNSFIPSQFDNPSNVEAHYQTTGPEIWKDTDGDIDYFVAGVGSGGTISGTGKFLKEKNKNIKVIAVEPSDSPMLKKGVFGPHKIQGIGANFIPKNYNSGVVDEVLDCSNENAFKYARLIAKLEGLSVGISSGAVLYSAICLAKKIENVGKNIVVILPDSGGKYFSTELYNF